MVFISADYRLIPPATGHEILCDIKDIFHFIESELNRGILDDWITAARVGRPFQINPHALAVSGSSAGGLCAYLAAIHASPRPKAVLSLYGMGGDMTVSSFVSMQHTGPLLSQTSQYLEPKSEPFFRGREILDPGDFSEYLHPASTQSQPTADSPLAYHPRTYRIPGYPANPRMLLGRLYLQMGTFLDYYTGSHNPSLSATLRARLRDQLQGDHSAPAMQNPGSRGSLQSSQEVIPVAHRHLFPQFVITPALPPMFLIHGSSDTAVVVNESHNLRSLLKGSGVRAELVVVEGKEHSFDYEPSAEDEFGGPGGLFDRAVSFLREALITE